MPKITTSQLSLSGTNGVKLTVDGTQLDISSLTQVGTLASKVEELDKNYQNLAVTLTTVQIKQDEQEQKLAQLESDSAVLGQEVSSQSSKLVELQTQLENLVNSQQSTDSAQIASTNQQVLADLNLVAPEIMLATGSATLAELNVTNKISTLSLETIDATVSGIFKAFGDSFLGNTTVAGDLVVDGTFSVNNGNTINSLPILYLQTNALAEAVDLFNGLVTITKDGLITAKNILVDQLGVRENTSAGTGIIKAGDVEVAIFNPIVEENSLIIVTPETNLDKPLAVTAKIAKSGFVVSLGSNASKDINFSYLIIKQEKANLTNITN